jgi:hypothetical protein
MFDEKIRNLEAGLSDLRAAHIRLTTELAELKMSRAQKAIRTFRRNKRIVLGTVACFVVIPMALQAFTIPNTFTAGTATVAADVNANFTAIKSQFDAMENKSWRLISEIDVSTASNQVDITGLNGDIDMEYKILAKLTSGNASGGGYYALRPNGDATAGNYDGKSVSGDGATPASSGLAPTIGVFFGYSSSLSSVAMVEISVLAKATSVRVFAGDIVNDIISGLISSSVGKMYYTWNSPGTNITFFRIVSPNTNGIGAGSHIEIWARR